MRTSDIRVSERTPLSQLKLTAFGPVYNELEKDVSPESEAIIFLYDFFVSGIAP